MQATRRTGTIVAVVVTLLVAPAGARAQSRSDGSDSPRAQALVDVEVNRSQVIRETIEHWRSQFQPAVPSQNIAGGEEELAAALRRASAEKLLAASQAQTYEDALAALYGRWQGPSVIPLEPGPIPSTLGSTSSDLVFTPITPCRIIDTRSATGGFAGRIGPNSGKQFQVNLADHSAQGGSATSCGMPTGFDVSGVAINVTSTDQTGLGNIAVVECGGGVPTVSLVNYTPGVNLANAAVSRSAIGCGLGGDIYIRSNNSASHVIVDIMGYYAAPVATAVENVKVSSSYISIPAGSNGSVFSPECPAGYQITGGGGGFPSGSNANTTLRFLFPYGADSSAFTQYNCGGSNGNASAIDFTCVSVCTRVPGR